MRGNGSLFREKRVAEPVVRVNSRFDDGDRGSRAVWRAPEMSYTTAPNSAPTPAVSAMASAPQKVTRMAAFVTGAPPA